jgi:predicted enzyme related to lactoylglutathione lyase
MPTPLRFPGSPIWTDLLSSDPDRAADFYGQLFGWTSLRSSPEYGGYTNFYKHRQRVAGMVSNTSTTPDGWTVYLATQDADDTAASVLANEGRVIKHSRIADAGTVVLFVDPTGAVAGAWQPSGHPGYDLASESGTAVWHELHTRDYRASLRFYGNVFDWSPTPLGDTDEFRMSTVGAPSQALAAVYDATYLSEDDPSRWMVYFGVADPDETSELIRRLGGMMLDEITDSPYGRLGHAADPTGALFTIIEVGGRP